MKELISWRGCRENREHVSVRELTSWSGAAGHFSVLTLAALQRLESGSGWGAHTACQRQYARDVVMVVLQCQAEPRPFLAVLRHPSTMPSEEGCEEREELGQLATHVHATLSSAEPVPAAEARALAERLSLFAPALAAAPGSRKRARGKARLSPIQFWT